MRELFRPLSAEAVGTLLLLATVVGSGIMAERLTTDVALALLCNTLATGAILFVVITMLAPISGAHFNPAVTLVVFLNGEMKAQHASAYVAVQIGAALLGVWLAHAMFDETVFAWGTKPRTGASQWLSEGVAVFGLVLTTMGLGKGRLETVAAAVALYIVAAYWFTASTSFANPAVTLARALTPTFSGILPGDAPAFIVAQLTGAATARLLGNSIFRSSVAQRDGARDTATDSKAHNVQQHRRR